MTTFVESLLHFHARFEILQCFDTLLSTHEWHFFVSWAINQSSTGLTFNLWVIKTDQAEQLFFPNHIGFNFNRSSLISSYFLKVFKSKTVDVLNLKKSKTKRGRHECRLLAEFSTIFQRVASAPCNQNGTSPTRICIQHPVRVFAWVFMSSVAADGITIYIFPPVNTT